MNNPNIEAILTAKNEITSHLTLIHYQLEHTQRTAQSHPTALFPNIGMELGKTAENYRVLEENFRSALEALMVRANTAFAEISRFDATGI